MYRTKQMHSSPTSYDEQENVASMTNPPVLGDEPRQIGKKIDFDAG